MMRMTGLAAAGCAAMMAVAGAAQAQAWKPDRNVEIVINTGPGSGQDATGRLMQKILQERRLVEAPMNVVNKPGGGGALAYGYLNEKAKDGHYTAIASKSLLTNHIMGRAPITYTHLTPLAILFEEYISVAVRADSSIKSGRDMLDRMKKDVGALSFGVATSIGNPNHQGVAMALKDAGVDIRKTRTVVFQSGGDAMTALLGGHVDVVPGSVGLMQRYVKAGQARIIAIAAPKRLGGIFAQTPTWREQGANALVSNWRGMVAPGGLTPAQTAFWDRALQGLTQSEDWKKELEQNNWEDEFQASAAARKYMEADYGELKAFLTELELAKVR